MNKKQKVVFLVGVGIIMVMGLIPPWHIEVLFNLNQKFPCTVDAGYGFLFSPPARLPTWGSDADINVAPFIALSQLCVQWAIVAIGVGGILIALRGSQNRKPRDESGRKSD